jgi:hypothetical protein
LFRGDFQARGNEKLSQRRRVYEICVRISSRGVNFASVLVLAKEGERQPKQFISQIERMKVEKLNFKDTFFKALRSNKKSRGQVKLCGAGRIRMDQR